MVIAQRGLPLGARFQVGEWLVEPALNRVGNGRQERHMEPLAMNLLVFLASRPGEVVSRQQIVDVVWEGRFIADITLTRTIVDIRQVLGDDRHDPRYIETIPKRGYRLTAPVRPAAPAPPLPAAAADSGPSALTLLVLPFSSLGPDEGDRYFCEGLTEELINALTRVPGLRVIARTSAFAAGHAASDPADAAARLGASHLVEGSVRRSGRAMRITAQLIEAADRCHIWSERYDRDVADVFAVQDEIARAITERLRVSLAKRSPAEKKPTADLDAYRAFLEGRHHFLKSTPDGLARAKACYERAIARDPLFAMAHDALSELYWHLGFFGVMEPREAFALGVWESLRALEIDDTLAQAHAELAMYRKELDYNWSEVRREFDRALELDPCSPVVLFRRAVSGLMPQGQVQEAAAVIARLLDSDPLSIWMRWWHGVMMILARDWKRGREQGLRLIEIDPAHQAGYFVLGACQMGAGERLEAVTTMERAAALSGRAPWLLGWLGLAQVAAGRRGEARALLDELKLAASRGYVPPTALAFILLGLEEIDGAFRELERAIEVRDPHIIPILTYPVLDPIRDDPRFRRLLQAMNLA